MCLKKYISEEFCSPRLSAGPFLFFHRACIPVFSFIKKGGSRSGASPLRSIRRAASVFHSQKKKNYSFAPYCEHHLDLFYVLKGIRGMAGDFEGEPPNYSECKFES